MTLGEKLNEIALKQERSPDKQEAGETASEMGKKFLKDIQEAVSNARKKGAKGKIYIHVIERPLQFARNAVQRKIFTRKTRPTPEPCSYLFSHMEGSNPKFEYCLPEINHVPFIFAHKHNFTDKYINDVTLWLQNKLS